MKVIKATGDIEVQAYKLLMRDKHSSLTSWSAFLFCEIVRKCCISEDLVPILEKYAKQVSTWDKSHIRRWPDDEEIEVFDDR